MNNMQLSKHFFEDNPLDEESTAMITYLRMLTIMVPNFDEQLNQMIISRMEKSRYEQCSLEREYIENLENPEDIVSYMRKIKDPVNTYFLIQKAIAYQDKVVPLVLKKICTSGYDVFIENTFLLLGNVDAKYAEDLHAVFPDIRNAYARSELCIIFGYRKKIEYTPLIMEQLKKIRKEQPEEDWEQGPLLALYLLYEEM